MPFILRALAMIGTVVLPKALKFTRKHWKGIASAVGLTALVEGFSDDADHAPVPVKDNPAPPIGDNPSPTIHKWFESMKDSDQDEKKINDDISRLRKAVDDMNTTIGNTPVVAAPVNGKGEGSTGNNSDVGEGVHKNQTNLDELKKLLLKSQHEDDQIRNSLRNPASAPSGMNPFGSMGSGGGMPGFSIPSFGGGSGGSSPFGSMGSGTDASGHTGFPGTNPDSASHTHNNDSNPFDKAHDDHAKTAHDQHDSSVSDNTDNPDDHSLLPPQAHHSASDPEKNGHASSHHHTSSSHNHAGNNHSSDKDGEAKFGSGNEVTLHGTHRKFDNEEQAHLVRKALALGDAQDQAGILYPQTRDGNHGERVSPKEMQPGDYVVVGTRSYIIAQPGEVVVNKDIVPLSKIVNDDADFKGIFRKPAPESMKS